MNSRFISLSLLVFLIPFNSAIEPLKDDVRVHFYDKESFEKITDEKLKEFFTAGFSEAEFEPNCQDKKAMIIVPIYFNPGDNVELPCKVCEWGFAFNGLPKTWRHIKLYNTLDFLENPIQWVRNFGPVHSESLTQAMTVEGGGYMRHLHLVKAEYYTLDTSNSEVLPDVQKIPSIHSFLQAHGRLYIRSAQAESSGVYYCYDDLSRAAHTRVFYLLLANTPLVFRSDMYDSKFATAWNVDHWQSSGLPFEERCADPLDYPIPDEYSHMRYTPSDLKKIKPLPLSADVKLHGPNGQTKSLNLELDLEYSPWTECMNGVTYREAHCILRRKEGQLIPASDSSKPDYDVFYRLNSYFDHFKTLRVHSYMLVSLFYKKDTFHGTEKESCETRTSRVWNAYLRSILTSITGGNIKDLTDLLNPGSTAISDSMRKNAQYCYDIGDRRINSVFTIRGVSFIDSQTCP